MRACILVRLICRYSFGWPIPGDPLVSGRHKSASYVPSSGRVRSRIRFQVRRLLHNSAWSRYRWSSECTHACLFLSYSLGFSRTKECPKEAIAVMVFTEPYLSVEPRPSPVQNARHSPRRVLLSCLCFRREKALHDGLHVTRAKLRVS